MLEEYLLLFSDSEEENADVVCYNERQIRRNLRDHSDPLALPIQSFIKRFRLSKVAFKYVLDNLNLKTGTRQTYIPKILRLCSTLEVLAGGGYQWLIGNDCVSPIAQSTLSKIFQDCIEALESQFCNEWIKWPSETEKNAAKHHFFQKYKIPGVIGCVDGTHVSIMRPKEMEEIFFNRKGHHSINAMIINDHNCRIMAVCAQYGGAAHDSFVWNNSTVKNELEANYNRQGAREHSLLLGDSGYPLEPWLLTPYRRARTAGEINFNTVHAKARNVNERCIGILKGRWRILSIERRSRYNPSKASQYINVCAALHNICIHYNVSILQRANEDDSPYHWEAEETNTLSLKKAAEKNRDSIKMSLQRY